jgi:cobalt/nickel transport system permease protein
MIDDLFLIEKYAYRNSPVHTLDARVKILVAFAAIIAIVAVPYSTVVYSVGAVFIIFCAALWGLSGLSPVIYVKRLLVILPFGIFLIVFQIFFKNRYYETFTTLATLPFGIEIYAESVEFASILLIKFLVAVSFIILLSSTTKTQDLLEGAGRLGLPAEFTLVLGMMLRYLYVFGYMIRKMRQSLETRCFDPFDRSLPYRYRLEKLAYAVGTLFIRSYEQGERTYLAMLCRGYGRESHLYISKKPLKSRDWAFLSVGLLLAVATPVLVWAGLLRIG